MVRFLDIGRRLGGWSKRALPVDASTQYDDRIEAIGRHQLWWLVPGLQRADQRVATNGLDSVTRRRREDMMQLAHPPQAFGREREEGQDRRRAEEQHHPRQRIEAVLDELIQTEEEWS